MWDAVVSIFAGKVMLLAIPLDAMIFNPTDWAGFNLRVVDA
jgi:hypothetical protein